MKNLILIVISFLLIVFFSCTLEDTTAKATEAANEVASTTKELVDNKKEPVKIEESVKEKPFQVVKDMPRFPGCEDKASAERRTCAEGKMVEFIYKNLKYPIEARENAVEGTVVIRFIVEKDGSISDAQIFREIGGECGVEALRVVNLMNTEGIKWIPGKQKDKAVRVQYNLPIRFKLE